MAKEKVCGIYQLKNKVNGKIYIGQSRDIYMRWTKHKNTAFNKNSKDYDVLLYKAIRKYGWDNFEKSIIETCSIEELDEKEKYYIEKYKSYDTTNIGYNLRYGGQHGALCNGLSEEARKKISQSHMGKTWTEEHKKRHSKLMSGGNAPKAVRVHCDGKWYDCIKDCAEYYGVEHYAMIAYLNKSEKMPWKFYELDLHREGETRDDYPLTSRIPIICENMEFYSLTDLSNYYNVSIATFSAWLSHRNRLPLEWYQKRLHRANETMENYEIQK